MIRTILFDLDGTLADTEPLHFIGFAETLRTEGIELSEKEYFSRLIGFNDHDCFEAVLKENGKDASAAHLEKLIARKAVTYQDMIRNRDVMYPGAAEFVRECAARFPLMVVTGTLRDEAEMILHRAGIRDLFLDIVAAEDVEHGKPQPDGFLAALGRLGFLLRQRDAIEPAQALVIEDTPAGVQAGKRAGMRVLALNHTAADSDLAGADLIRKSLRDTDLDEILRRLA
jgi:HAD superfamily hydrolase (TIGR01509 family)